MSDSNTSTTTTWETDVNQTDTVSSLDVSTSSATSLETGNSIGGGYTFSEAATQAYSFSQFDSTSGYSGTTSFSLVENGDKAYSLTQSGSHVMGDYSIHETGLDSFTIAESGGTAGYGGGGGGGGGGSSSGSSSNSSTTWNLTLSGADNYTTNETGNELSNAFGRTITGGGSDSLVEGASLASTHYNSTPSTAYTVNESGNYLSGVISLTETGTDRYSLIQAFNNASNATAFANGPGDVEYSPVGAPFHMGGTPYWGHGPAADLSAAASDAAFNELGLQLLHEYCFPRGTPIVQNGVWRMIEDYVCGGEVSAVHDGDPEGAIATKRVAQFYENQPARLWHVRVNGELIRTTANHPFYVRGRGFVAASLLKPGDELRSYRGIPAFVTNVIESDEVEPVYNLRVADSHTYFVGTLEGGVAVLVHNASPGAAARPAGGTGAPVGPQSSAVASPGATTLPGRPTVSGGGAPRTATASPGATAPVDGPTSMTSPGTAAPRMNTGRASAGAIGGAYGNIGLAAHASQVYGSDYMIAIARRLEMYVKQGTIALDEAYDILKRAKPPMGGPGLGGVYQGAANGYVDKNVGELRRQKEAAAAAEAGKPQPPPNANGGAPSRAQMLAGGGRKPPTGGGRAVGSGAMDPGDGEFRVGRHGDMPSPRPGKESHHGLMSKWMEENFKDYNPDDAPGVLMPKANHNATRGAYNRWRAEMRQKQGGTFDWNKVSKKDMLDLSERMFDAAKVPSHLRAQYYQQFEKFVKGLKPK